MMRIVAVYGSSAIAGYTIALRIIELTFLPAWGLGNAAATLVGQNLGAQKPDRAARAVWQTARYNFVFLVSVAVIFIAQSIGMPLGVGTLVVGWLVYDVLCRSPLGARPATLATVGFVLTTLVAWALVGWIGSRAAYIHVGAMLGTIMALNVFRVIIPAS